MRPWALVGIALLLAFGLFVHPARAQPGPKAEISAALNYQSLPPDQQAVVAVVIDIPKGLHAQSHTPLKDNYIALDVIVKAHPAITNFQPIYPQGVIKNYGPPLGELSVYE